MCTAWLVVKMLSVSVLKFPLDCLSGSSRFDASQYEFFGQHAGQGVELSGLEEDDYPVFGPVDDEYRLFDRDEVRFLLPCIVSMAFPDMPAVRW